MLSVQQNPIVDICSNSEETAESGFIRSPNYPRASVYQQQCECQLSTQPYSAIPLTLLDFHSDKPGCDANKLQVQHNGNSNTYCAESTNAGTQIKVESNKVSLTFNTAGSTTGGFWLKFKGNVKNMTVLFQVKHFGALNLCKIVMKYIVFR